MLEITFATWHWYQVMLNLIWKILRIWATACQKKQPLMNNSTLLQSSFFFKDRKVLCTCLMISNVNLATCKENCHKSRGFCEKPGECRWQLFFQRSLYKNRPCLFWNKRDANGLATQVSHGMDWWILQRMSNPPWLPQWILPNESSRLHLLSRLDGIIMPNSYVDYKCSIIFGFKTFNKVSPFKRSWTSWKV